LLLEADARVYKNEWIAVGSISVPGNKPAVAVDWGISIGYEFSDGTDDTVVGSVRLPQDMDRTVAPEFKIGWASADNTGDVVWQLEYLYRAVNEDTTAVADDTLETTTTVSATANGLTISTITGIATPAASDQLFLFRLKRLGDDEDDNLGDDNTLIGHGLKYTKNTLGVPIG